RVSRIATNFVSSARRASVVHPAPTTSGCLRWSRARRTRMNAVAARSVLPRYLPRTEWVIAGVAKAEIQRRETTARAAGKLHPPEPDAMCYMLSKGGHLNDDVGHWHPHVMFYAPKGDVARWGANLPGSPVLVETGFRFVFRAPRSECPSAR